MPETTRRELLSVGLTGLAAVSVAASAPTFVSKMALAAPAGRAELSNDNILVVVQLSGGNDGLNTIVPVGNDAYYKARPVIALKRRLLRLTGGLALNPGMAAFKALYDQGQLAIVHGCGYPTPSRSHFTSMHIWHTADPHGGAANGWLGRFLDHHTRGTTNAMPAVNLGPQLPQALVADSGAVPSIESVEDCHSEPGLLPRPASSVVVSPEAVRKLADGYKADADYPPNLGQKLKLIAHLIAGELGTKVFYCEVGGFDTHANQNPAHERLWANVSQSIRAFHKDIAAKGYRDKVTVMCFSEFGRRIAQNDSYGTDHGTAGPMFVSGAKVKGGMYGAYPSLTDTENADLKYTTDFRRVYATVLDRWLNCDSTQVLGNKFEPVPLIGGVMKA